MKPLIAVLAMLATSGQADTIVAARTIPAQTVIGLEDIVIQDHDTPGSISDPSLVVGMESRVALFAGRPIVPSQIGQPAVVERNQIIALHYQHNGLRISTEGRALGRGGYGEMVPVMNMSSRSTVTARIGPDGAGYVTQ